MFSETGTGESGGTGSTPKKTRIKLLLVNLLSLAGFIVSGVLVKHYYEVRSGLANFKSFCNINSVVNCDIVAASPFAELVYGIPLASFAAGWFLALLALTLMAHRMDWRKEALRLAFWFSAGGTLIGLGYLGVMLVKLRTFCMLCFAIDCTNVLSLVLLATLQETCAFDLSAMKKAQWRILLPVAVVAVAVSVFGFRSLDRIKLTNAEIDDLARSVINNPPLAVTTGQDYPSVGPKSAVVTITEFSDFQCPVCKLGASTINTIFHRFPGQIRIEFRNFPIDPACNGMVDHKGHPAACEAAKVAICANQFGKFEEIYEAFFENQGSLAPGVPTKIAEQNGIDPKKLEKCINSPETARAVEKDLQEAINLGIGGTPTFFVNGHRMESVHPIASWNRIVEYFVENAPH